MYVDELEEQSIKRWMQFFKDCPDLQTQVIGESPTLVSGSTYQLANYNVVNSTILISGTQTLNQYMPYDRNNTDSQISAIIVSGGTSPFTVSYCYNPFAILTRSRKSIDSSLFKTPRAFVLWGNSMALPYRRQLKAGKLTTRRRGYLTIALDVDDHAGGYTKQVSLLGKIWAAIESNHSALYNLGFEDILVQEIPTNENYESEEPLEISRGILMIAFTIYPEIRR